MKILKPLINIWLVFFMAVGFQIGCASGGFKWTRKYAGFVNKQNIFLRIILYIFVGFIFVFTIIADVVIFNTIDFWTGKVSANEYNFTEGDKHYVVKHSHKGEKNLKNTLIEVYSKEDMGAKKVLQTIELAQTQDDKIQIFVDQKLKATVDSIYDVPQITVFDGEKKIKNLPLFNMRKSYKLASL